MEGSKRDGTVSAGARTGAGTMRRVSGWGDPAGETDSSHSVCECVCVCVCVCVCTQSANSSESRQLTLSPWSPSLTTCIRYKIYCLETNSKHNDLFLPNWKERKLLKLALRQVRHHIKYRSVRMKDPYGVFMANLTGPCTTFPAIMHPSKSLPRAQKIYTLGTKSFGKELI